jgi:hypothetical protein
MKLCTTIFVLYTLVAACTYSFAQVTPVKTQGLMPTIKAETLNEREVTLPQDLPGEKTLVLIAFEREQQKNVDTWVSGLNLKSNPFAWIETPVIDPKNPIFRAFINNGMRRGIPDTDIREKTITLYTNRAEFVKSMGMNPSTSTITAAVVDRKGAVLAKAEGDYSAEKAAALLAALAHQTKLESKLDANL